jgi:MYXO-CTERM domain-containing protein
MATHDVGPGAAGDLEGPAGDASGDVPDPFTIDWTDADADADATDAATDAGDGFLDDPDPTTRRATSGLLVVAGGLALLLIVIVAVKAWTWDWLAVGDYGSLRLRTLDVGTSHTPLLGVYSRWGWNHPGPMLFYLLAPFVRLAGGDGHGLLLGALAINVAAIGATVWVAARAGRRVLALTALVLALLVVGLDPAWTMDAWNPYVMILPLFAAAVSAWRAALGDRVAAVVFVVAGSFALQCHVLAGPPVAVLLAVVVVGLGLRAWRGPEPSHDRRTVLLAVAVGIVCWIPPIVDQATNSPGNLRQILSFLLHGDETPVGWGLGARVVGRALSFPPLWITGGASTASRPIPWALFALVVATAWAWRRRWSGELLLCAVAWLLVLAAFVGSSRVTGVAFPYLFQWLRIVAAVVWMAVGLVVVAEVARRWSWAKVLPAVMAGVTAVLLLGLIVAGPDLGNLERSDRPLRDVYGVIDPTLDALRDAPGPVVMTPTVFGIDSSVGIELLRVAERDGIDVRFGPDLAHVVGSQRTIDPSEAGSELVLASGEARGTYANDPRYRLIAEFEPLTPEEWAEYDRLSAIDWGGNPPDSSPASGPEYDRYRELSDLAFENLSIFLATGPPPTSG